MDIERIDELIAYADKSFTTDGMTSYALLAIAYMMRGQIQETRAVPYFAGTVEDDS